MLNTDKYYVVDRERGIAIRQHRRQRDGYSSLFTWIRPQLFGCGMSRAEADNFVARYSGVPGVSELGVFQGKDFTGNIAFEDFCINSIFQRVDVCADWNGVNRKIFSNLPKWSIDLAAWQRDNPELQNWKIQECEH